MVEAQIKIPDHLYAEVQRLAAENEMSVAEVVRRGLELIVGFYAPGRTAPSEWILPPAVDLGAPLAPEEQWTELSHD